ncbi:hypothetical protein L596_026297 [Steinernema carpocapsae]|uniref:Uncharacterized protein n=2 Tax=Steinernema carpocapsae TaxID=34508 RepID=A0A4U5M0Y1_STECR|nr:hypothetical protein L596_026297 [Steinernema carpocapsae]
MVKKKVRNGNKPRCKGAAEQIMDRLQVKPHQLIFCNGFVNLLDPLSSGDEKCLEVYEHLLEEDFFSYKLLKYAEIILCRNKDDHKKDSRMIFLHVAVTLQRILKDYGGRLNEKDLLESYRKLKTKGKKAEAYNRRLKLPNFSFTDSLLSHYVRQGKPEGLTISEYLNTLVERLFSQEQSSVSEGHDKEPKKFFIADVFTATDPGNPNKTGYRCWYMFTKDICGVRQICTLSFCCFPTLTNIPGASGVPGYFKNFEFL